MSDTAAPRSEAFIDQLLLEADMDDDGRLRPALLELRALADAAPEPSAAIAALLAPAGTAATGPAAAPGSGHAAAVEEVPYVDELAARRRSRRRIALTTLSVAVSLSAGGAVAAASDQGIRESFTQLNHVIASYVTGYGAAPAGNRAEDPAAPLPRVPAGTATVPAAPAPAPAAESPAELPSSEPTVSESVQEQAAAPGKPAEVPAPDTLPTAVPEDLTDGLGRPPATVPAPSDIPLPGTLPAVPLR